jgi:hypothetical protein
MDVKVAVVYFADAGSGAAGPIELHLIDDHFEFRASFALVRNYSRATRIDFLDPANESNILAIIPSLPNLSSIGLSDDGSNFAFSLQMRNLLGGAPAPCKSNLLVTPGLNTGKTQVHFTFLGSAVAGIFLGSGDVVFDQFSEDDYPFHNYLGVLQQLVDLKQPPTMKVGGAAPSPFEAAGVSNCAFNTDTVTFRTRTITVGPGLQRKVLVLSRDYTPGDACVIERARLGRPFDLPIPPSCNAASPYSTVQYPGLTWLAAAATPATQFTPEPPFWQFETGEFPPEEMEQFWIERVLTPYVGGLRAINAPLPVSLMPSLSWVTPAVGAPAVDRNWRILRFTSISPDGSSLAMLDERLAPGGFLLAKDGSPAADVSVQCLFPAFRTHDGTALSLTATLSSWLSGNQFVAIPPSPLVRRLVVNLASGTLQTPPPAPPAPPPPPVPQALRLGSLDLSFSGALTIPLAFEIQFVERRIDPGVWTPTVFLHGSLPVSRVAPGGQDPVPGDTEFRLTPDPGTPANAGLFTRSNPIVIDAQTVIDADLTRQGGTLAPAVVHYNLAFSELTLAQAGPQQQQVVLTLSSVDTTPPTPQVLVLDREPFLVAMVTLSAASAGDDTDTTLVGVWCNLYPEGPGWRLRAGAGGFNLYLPPQAVGEAMVKDFTPHQGKASGAAPGVQADYRFSPLLFARLLATYFTQNAVEPGWNTRRVLGYAGQQLPGAPVDAANGGLTFELLYGLTTSVTQPSLHLSEMFARLGNFPGPLPDLNFAGFSDPEFTQSQNHAYNDAATAWAIRFSQLLSRPGVLELWDDPQASTLILDSGVDYSIRKDVFYKGEPPLLAGGIGFAVDSGNIGDELTRDENLKSTAGRLVSPCFTALGGYGTQRAEFANGKIIVDSRTSMGRLESLTITLVGRIGNYYNHALHVTVYERTVAASEQFYLEQPTLTQIPWLRKTSEYVQITEDSRSYPESGAADPALAGFVQAATFKSTRIFVDSVWGGDVGDIGWQVPLYKVGAQPAAVYLKPHIALQVAVDPATGVDAVFSEIDDPEKLCFYTDTRSSTTSDTDSWPMIPEIDWIDQPANTDLGALYQEPSVEIGFGRFTYHFVQSPAQVNVVAQRAKTAVGAALKNVSMMRGQRQPAVANDGLLTPAQRVKRIGDWWTATRAHLEQAASSAAAAGAGTSQALLANALQAVQQSYIVKVDAKGNLLAGNLVDDLSKLSSAPVNLCEAVKGRLTGALGRLDGQKNQAVHALLTDIPEHLTAVINQQISADLATAKTDLSNYLTVGMTGIRGTLKPFLGTVDDAVVAFNAYFPQTGQSELSKLQAAIADLQTNLVATNPAATVEAKLGLILPGSDLRMALDAAAFLVTSATRSFLGDGGTKLVIAVDAGLDAELQQFEALLANGTDAWKNLVQKVHDDLQPLHDLVANAILACRTASTTLNNLTPQPIYAALDKFETNIGDLIANTTATTSATLQASVAQAIQDYFVTPTTAAMGWVDNAITSQEAWIGNTAGSLCSALSQDVDALKNAAVAFLKGQLFDLLHAATGDVQAFTSALANVAQQAESQLAQLASNLVQPAETVVSSVAGAALQVIRAFGEPPNVPTMTFAVPLAAPTLPLPVMAYRFTNALPNVDLTPARAVVQQAAQIAENAVADSVKSLSQLGVSLPTTQLLDRLLPDALQNFDLRDVLPKFAGIDLSTLFAGVGLPSVANDNVRITHHIDPQSRRASLDAAIHVPLAGETSILDLGPVNLALLDAEFDADVHCDVTVGQQLRQVSTGQITGDWELSIAGNALVTFTKTTLSFDSSGSLHFSISPANVRLSAVLQFLADIVNSFSFGDSGFYLHMVPVPLSVQCVLDLPLPDMSAGAFGIQNLHFGALFEIGVDDNGFYLGVGANLARQTAPFILTVFILGGAGWMEAYLRYQNGKATGKITIGMGASASLALSLGPISGSVSIQFAIFAELAIGTGGGLSLGIMILVVGRVSLLGIVDANITLLLEAQYSSGGGLVGRGYVSVSIKICWCFTLNVQTGVQFTFGAASANRAQSARPAVRMAAAALDAPAPPATNPEFNGYATAALAYVDMLAA